MKCLLKNSYLCGGKILESKDTGGLRLTDAGYDFYS